jgi:PPM family protein phosphatase
VHKTFHLENFGLTDIGLIRDHNEDVWAAYPEEGLFLVADGMGGHSSGEVASKEAVEHFYKIFSNLKKNSNNAPEEAESLLKKTFIEVNQFIFRKGSEDENLHGMGTTLCALFFQKQYAVLAHVGDSRIYLLRDSKLQQLTEDHSLVNEMVSVGAMSQQEAENFPYRHILTKAIGTQPTVTPTVDSIRAEPHDLFLLCSDGLTNFVHDGQIQNILQTKSNLQNKGWALVNLANEQGGGDNITLILVEISA